MTGEDDVFVLQDGNPDSAGRRAIYFSDGRFIFIYLFIYFAKVNTELWLFLLYCKHPWALGMTAKMCSGFRADRQGLNTSWQELAHQAADWILGKTNFRATV